jgi:hypothetical protein
MGIADYLFEFHNAANRIIETVGPDTRTPTIVGRKVEVRA